MDYATALKQYEEREKQYQNAVKKGLERKEITRLSGRLVASLQALRKVAIKNDLDITEINTNLNAALDTHKGNLTLLDDENRNSKNGQKYSIITELSTGFKTLINSIGKKEIAQTDEEKKAANKDILNSVGQNLKNIVKAPIALTTKILRTGIVGQVLLAPISLGLGILHAAWECMDSNKSPYEGKTVQAMSKGFTQVMTSLDKTVQRI